MAESVFIDAAKSAFAFLTTDYGFDLKSVRLATKDNDFEQVRYESDRVQVSVWHTEKMRDADVHLRWLSASDPSESFSLGQLSELETGQSGKVRRLPERNDELRVWVTELAAELRQFGDQALRGDARVFEGLRNQLDEKVRLAQADPDYPELKRKLMDKLQEFEQRRTSRPTKRRAEWPPERPAPPPSESLLPGDDPDAAMRIRTRVVAAFGREDWAEAVRLLESIEGYLTPLEREQLHYARDHVS